MFGQQPELPRQWIKLLYQAVVSPDQSISVVATRLVFSDRTLLVASKAHKISENN